MPLPPGPPVSKAQQSVILGFSPYFIDLVFNLLKIGSWTEIYYPDFKKWDQNKTHSKTKGTRSFGTRTKQTTVGFLSTGLKQMEFFLNKSFSTKTKQMTFSS